jgi:hypothetical protein
MSAEILPREQGHARGFAAIPIWTELEGARVRARHATSGRRLGVKPLHLPDHERGEERGLRWREAATEMDAIVLLHFALNVADLV